MLCGVQTAGCGRQTLSCWQTEETQTPPTGHRKKEEINDAIVPSLLGISLLRTPQAQRALLGGKAGCVYIVCLFSLGMRM